MKCPIPLRALVVEQESRVTKNGDLFWQVILKTRVGNIKAFMWDAPKDVEQNTKYPHVNDIIEVDGFKDQLEERKNIVIQAFHRILKNDLPPEDRCILEFEKATDKELAAAWKVIEDASFWEEEKHHQFTMACIQRLGRDRVEKSPAAAAVHHHYQGGLLVHTAEVLNLCRAYVLISQRYNFINKDVVFSAAILHDIGKVDTYIFNDLGVAKQSPIEKTVGHLFFGMNLVQDVFGEMCHVGGPLEDVNKQFVTEVLHCIAAHHGKREWGSIVEPQSLEAGIVSRMDYLSSRNGMMEKLLQESIKSGQPLQDEFRVYGDPYFASLGIRKYVAEGQSE